MDLRRVLRILIGVEIAMVIVAIIEVFFERRFLPQPLRHWLQQEADRPITSGEIVIAVLVVPLFAAVVVSWIGLWRLWRPSRRLYLVTVALGIIATMLVGPQVSSGIGWALQTVASIVTGSILALVYFSPLSEVFERPRAAPAGGFDVTMDQPNAAP
jgi:hypothetical protein